MIERRATTGLTLLCALMFCAFAAQSASAQKGTAAINTTAFTCVENGGLKDFSDAHCDTFVGAEKGKFGHVAIKAGETTAIEVTNDKTPDNTIGSYVAKLNTTHLAVNVEITCTTVKSKAGGKSWLRNNENGTNHSVEGTVEVEFTGCTSNKPAACKIKEPIVTIAKTEGVEGLKGGGKEKTMGVEFTQDEGKPFATFEYGPEAACAFKNSKFTYTGSTIATGKPDPSSTTKHSGATSIFIPNKTPGTPAEEMQTLKFSTSVMHFDARFTTRMSGGGNPIALTTVT